MLFHHLTSAQADLDEATCPVPIWFLLADDQQLTSLWSEVDSLGHSLAKFLDASAEEYSLPESSPIMVVRSVHMKIDGRLPFDNYELLRQSFPPSTRPELEARVLHFRDVLLAYYNLLLAKVRDLLYSTRIPERLVNSHLSTLLLRGSFIVDEANIERFRIFFQVLEDGDNGDYDYFDLVEEDRESLKSVLAEMEDYSWATNPRSRSFSLLRGYIAHADGHREEMLRFIIGYLDFHIGPAASTQPPLVPPRRTAIPLRG